MSSTVFYVFTSPAKSAIEKVDEVNEQIFLGVGSELDPKRRSKAIDNENRFSHRL